MKNVNVSSLSEYTCKNVAYTLICVRKTRVYVLKRGELVNADAQDQWKSKESVLQACHEVCGKKKDSRKHVVLE